MSQLRWARVVTWGGAVLLLGALVLAAHGSGLRAEFVAWDDLQYVTGNPQVQAEEPVRWLRIFDPRVLVVEEWTPVVTATHIVERHLLGTGPLIYHATNLVLQLLCALAALGLLTELGLPFAAALGAAAVFAAHPLQVESVAWVAARKNLLSTLFFLLAARAYLAGRGPSPFARGLGWFLLAILSKATAVVLPAWLAAIHLLRRDRPIGRWALHLTPFFIIGIARGLYSVVTQAEAVHRTAELGLVGRMATMGPVLARYARQLIWPNDLALLYPWPALAWTDATVLLSWTCVGLLIMAVIIWGRRDRRALEVGLLVPIALFPALNLIPAPFLQADRYVHLALVGVVGLLALGPGLPRLRPPAVMAALVAAALILSFVARERTSTWLDSERLWGDALRHDPEFAPGHSNLGLHLLSAGRIDDAMLHLKRAAELEPDRALWRANLAAALVSDEQLIEARRLLESAVDENPKLAEALGTLAVIALRENRDNDALALARRAAALRPGDPFLEVHVAEALAALGRGEEAGAHYASIAQIYPVPQVLLGWADLERARGHLERAEELYQRLLRAHPEDADAGYNLATLQLNAGDHEGALRGYDRLLAFHPDHEAAHNNRGSALLSLGRFEAAQSAYGRAVELAPDDPRYRTNLANVLAARGRCTKALPLYETVLAVDPDSAVARLNLATCLVRTGRRPEAIPLLHALEREGVYPDRVRALLAETDEGSPP